MDRTDHTSAGLYKLTQDALAGLVNSQVSVCCVTCLRFHCGSVRCLQKSKCYGTFCRPCTICRRWQIVPTLAAHYVAPMHNLTPGDKMCCSGRYVWGRQNVPCKSAYFVIPHWMDLNIQWYLFAKYERSNVIHLMVCICYIHYISALALICVVLTMLW